MDRTLALEFPCTWKFKRAWRVEAGSDHTDKIAPYGGVRALLAAEPGQSVIALADYTKDFDPHAAGIGYFVVFSTVATKGDDRATVKAALVERTSPGAPQEFDPKTKRPIPQEHNWRMTFPSQYDFSFASITSKRLVASVDIEQVPRTERALVVSGAHAGVAPLRVRPDLFEEYFHHPFSIEFWFRTNAADETLLHFTTNGGSLRLAIGLLGQPMLTEIGRERKTLLAGRAITNDGAWHCLVLSCDSLGTLRLFVDAELSAENRERGAFDGITAADIGDSTSANKDFSLDELCFVHGAYREAEQFASRMTSALPDSAFPPFAMFHFDDFAWRAFSSVPETAPIYFTLDSATTIRETTSPVQMEPVLLMVEMPSPSTVRLRWSRTSEQGIKAYELQLRVGAYGPFETFSSITARHGLKSPERGKPIISWEEYNTSEELPQLNRNIDLYFRIAAIGFNKNDPPQYSLPVKVEYATDRDIFVEQNDPEPFQDSTRIAFTLTKPEVVRLSVFDMIGREIVVLVNARLDPGRHVYTLDASQWPAGIYFYKVTTARATITRKMTLIK